MKKKMSLVLAMVVAMTLAVPTPAHAAVQLPAPAWARWSGSVPGTAQWGKVDGCEGEYEVVVYKNANGEKEEFDFFPDMNLRGTFNFGFYLDDTAEYTFRVRAIGDGVNNTTSQWSELSEPYHYEKPSVSFGPVRHVRWTGGGNVAWDEPLGIPAKYRNSVSYTVRLYRNGKWLRISSHRSSRQINLLHYMKEDDAKYTVSVEVSSLDIEHIANGPEVFGDEYIDTNKVGNSVSDSLDGLTNSLGENLASPSDAMKSLEGMDLGDMAVAVQGNSRARRSLERLEEEYLKQTGGRVDISVSDDAGINGSEIEVTGAGLNVASPGDAVSVHFAKPDLPADVDPALYKNLIQFDIHLEGAKSGELRSPVVIVMPVPDGVKGTRLYILHHRMDGTYDIIYPTLIENNTKARFTVTEFSTFSFVTDPDGAVEPPEETDPPQENVTPGGWITGQPSARSQGNGRRIVNSEWQRDAVGWRYLYTNGTFVTSKWELINDKWYYFGSDGYMMTGWQQIGGVWYHLDDSDGNMDTGWYFDQSDGYWYYLDVSGAMLTGWQTISGKSYYLHEGTMAETGRPYGSMYADEATPDGYIVDASGAWVQ